MSKFLALFIQTRYIFKNVMRSFVCFSHLPGVLWQHNEHWLLSSLSGESTTSLEMVLVQCTTEKGQDMRLGCV